MTLFIVLKCLLALILFTSYFFLENSMGIYIGNKPKHDMIVSAFFRKISINNTTILIYMHKPTRANVQQLMQVIVTGIAIISFWALNLRYHFTNYPLQTNACKYMIKKTTIKPKVKHIFKCVFRFPLGRFGSH